jgi:hypothetical protein
MRITSEETALRPKRPPAPSVDRRRGQAGGRCDQIATADAEQGARGNVKLVPGAAPTPPTPPKRPVSLAVVIGQGPTRGSRLFGRPMIWTPILAVIAGNYVARISSFFACSRCAHFPMIASARRRWPCTVAQGRKGLGRTLLP